jgi:hypothetical protein
MSHGQWVGTGVGDHALEETPRQDMTEDGNEWDIGKRRGRTVQRSVSY